MATFMAISTIVVIFMAMVTTPMAKEKTHYCGKTIFTLHKAAALGNLQLLKKFEEEHGKGSLMEAKDSHGCCPLYYAALGGQTHVCKYLVDELNHDVNVQDDLGNTPLIIAIVDGHYDTFEYLLNNGAQPSLSNNDGFTALHYAVRKDGNDQLHLLISKGAEVDVLAFTGTPLVAAAKQGMKDVVKILLDNHADPNLAHRGTYTPLMLAVRAKSIDCVKLLLKSGADPNIRSLSATSLIVAASNGEIEMIECLLKAGADPNQTNYYGVTPLEFAAVEGHHAAVNVLFQATTRIQHVPNWSCHGIFEYVNSNEAFLQRNLKGEESIIKLKEEGAQAFKRSDYYYAALCYTAAKTLKPLDATFFSNSSLCWARLNNGKLALENALSCISLREDWPKAHYRAGVAWTILRDYEKAVDSFKTGLKLDPENKELQDAYRDALEDVGTKSVDDFGCLSIDGDDNEALLSDLSSTD